MKKYVTIILALLLCLPISFGLTGNEKITRVLSSTSVPGSSTFQVTYTISGTSGRYFATAEDVVSGGCTFSTGEGDITKLRLTMPSTQSPTATVIVKAPSSGSCIFHGHYGFSPDAGVEPVLVNMPDAQVTISTPGTCKTCAELGKQCGTWDNQCGGTITCGTNGACPSGQTCNSNGQCVTSGCTGGQTQSCTVSGCAGTQTCSNGVWGSCTKNDPNCGTSCTESWTCTDWSACSGGTQTKTCTDSNLCGTTINKPVTSQSCTTCSTKDDCDFYQKCDTTKHECKFDQKWLIIGGLIFGAFIVMRGM